jgi:hypothetical protein
VNTNLVNVSFPKASVGCNGIDIFLGSFSMINGDQLVQIGRGIAQGQRYMLLTRQYRQSVPTAQQSLPTFRTSSQH